MPTGYTAKLHDGKPQTFPEFVLDCARAFGALIEMRDLPADAPVPDEFKPSPYYQERLAATQQKLADVMAWTPEQADQIAQEEYEKAVQRWNDRRAERELIRGRYQDMLKQVRRWTPPSPEHVNLKEFMIKQLEESIDFDCNTSAYDTPPTPRPGAQYKQEELVMIHRDISYYIEQMENDRRRADERTEWVRSLKESIR